MYTRRKGSVWASEVADYLNRDLVGADFIIEGPSTLANAQGGSIICLQNTTDLGKLNTNGYSCLLFICSEPLFDSDNYSYILCDNPKLDFVVILHEFFLTEIPHETHGSAMVAETASLERNVSVGAFTIIGPEVSIGKNTIVMNHVVISGMVSIGSDCVIKDNAVIGSEGYRFVTDTQGRPLHIPPLGAIILGDRVWIGANSTLERAELKDTIIASEVKIDDLVNIGGGTHIAARSMITAGSVVSRGVVIGEDCWLAPNVSVRENTTIGDNVLVGLGSTVVKDLAEDGVYIGSPAKYLKKRG